MLICPTIFLNMKRQCNSCNESATNWSQVPCRHHLKSDQFLFLFTAVVQNMWPYQWLLLRHIAYPFTRRS